MNAAIIAAALGGAYRSGAWCRCRCPVHRSRGSTLALRDGDRGLVVVCHAGCRPPDILVELRRRGLIGGAVAGDDSGPDPVEIARRRDAELQDRQRRIILARDIIAGSRSPAGTPVE